MKLLVGNLEIGFKMASKAPEKKLNKESLKTVRQHAGLPEANIKKRSCLKCGRKFISEGNHNRKCERCRSFDKYHSSDVEMERI